MKKYFLSLSVLCLAGIHTMAQTPQRVKTSATLGIGAGDISGFSVNGKLVMATANDLYVTDGSDAGSSLLMQGVKPKGLVRAGNKLFFIGYSASSGYELWTSDGTAAGTAMVKDINPSGNAFSSTSCSGADSWLIVMGNEVYFPANDGTTGAELWKSDGTAAGTVIVKDINAYGGSMEYEPCDMNIGRGNWGAVVNNKLYFTASDSTHGYEIWESDGTWNGTQLFLEMSPGAYYSHPYPNMYYAFDNRFCFAAGINMYSCDAATANITMLSSFAFIQPNPDYTVIDDTLYFMEGLHDYGLWRTDGTALGTYSLAQGIKLQQYVPVSNRPFQLTAYKNRLYFTARNTQGESGLWQYEPGSAVTKLHAGGVGKLTPAGDKLYFKSRDSASRTDLWYTNGTIAGTKRIDYPGGNGTQGPVASGILQISAGVYVLNDSIYYTMMYDSLVYADLYKIGLFPLSVPETVQHKDVRIYPNPAQTFITIAGIEVRTVTVYNITGLLQKKQDGSNMIDISDLAPGQYFMHITTRDDQQLAERFVKY